MLAGAYQEQVDRLIAELDCKIQLPEKWANNFFDQSGMQPTSYDERRRHVRVNMRTKAILRIHDSFPSLKRERQIFVIYTCNVARGGVGFLHAEQLYPSELCELWLPKQKEMIEVAQCRQVGEQCYMIGARRLREQPIFGRV